MSSPDAVHSSWLLLGADEDLLEDGLDIALEEIDLPALAEQICALLRRELLLERERQSWPWTR